MRITFYKNCILTSAYSEVIDTIKVDAEGKSAFLRYLENFDTLNTLTIDVDNVYISNQGKLNVDAEVGYGYNYMSIIDTDRHTAFNSIVHRNQGTGRQRNIPYLTPALHDRAHRDNNNCKKSVFHIHSVSFNRQRA